MKTPLRYFAKMTGGCLGILLLWLAVGGVANAAFVYDTGGELLTSGDFNGDGATDILVLDKSSGNARVGYLDINGNLSWSAPLVSGVENVTSVAVGNFLTANTDAIAVTAPDFNLVNLVSLANSNSAASPVTITPTGLGPHTLVTLPNPLGLAGPIPPTLLVADADNNSAVEKLELLQISSGAASAAGSFPETGYFDRGNALFIPPPNSPNLAAGLVRGSTDRFDILQFTNRRRRNSDFVSRSCAGGGDYVSGTLTANCCPASFFINPALPTRNVVSLMTNSGALAFGPNILVSLTGGGAARFLSGVQQQRDGADSVQRWRAGLGHQQWRSNPARFIEMVWTRRMRSRESFRSPTASLRCWMRPQAAPVPPTRKS